MEYHKTKDILYIKNLRAHITLLETGFTYVSDYEGRKVLRKRK